MAVRRTPAQTGEAELIGDVGVVRRPLDPEGTIFVHGELWRARTEGEPIDTGAEVQVERIEDGLLLLVRPVESPAATVAAGT